MRGGDSSSHLSRENIKFSLAAHLPIGFKKYEMNPYFFQHKIAIYLPVNHQTAELFALHLSKTFQ